MNKDSNSPHQNPKRHLFNLSLNTNKKPRKNTINKASIFIKPLGLPLISKATHSPCKIFQLESYKPCTIGRNYAHCDFVFDDCRVSKTHCQILFDSSNKRIFLSDGLFFSFIECECSSRVRVSLNGVFVNGVRLRKGEVVELRVGDEVSLGWGNDNVVNLGVPVGFVVERIVLVEDIVDGDVNKFDGSGVSIDYAICRREGCKFDAKAGLLLSMCREILCSNDPIKYISKSVSAFDYEKQAKRCRRNVVDKFSRLLLSNNDSKLNSDYHKDNKEVSTSKNLGVPGDLVVNSCKETAMAPMRITELKCFNGNRDVVEQVDNTSVPDENGVIVNGKPEALSTVCMSKEEIGLCGNGMEVKNKVGGVPPPGRKFYLNRLHFMDRGSPDTHGIVSLPDLFYPIESLVRVFIATFTSDISWFLSYCRIPIHLPVTIACHNAERCWSSSPDKRTSMPYSDFPKLVVVYPPFPEVIAFSKDRRKKSGIACHHPKLLVLQREDSLRVVITSANLVERQWQNVTNTVWWQDFPRLSIPDYLSLFNQPPYGEKIQDLKSDFAAQLAGFIASLVADVPSQAHWVMELAKYDFKGALVHLITSVPGIHSPKSPCLSESKYLLSGNPCLRKTSGSMLLGSVESSVVGLSYLFRTSVDSNGVKLKKLATFLGKCYENVYGMSEILLRRGTNIPADANAVSILLPNPDELYVEECVQLGFLPRNVAKWVAPLSDTGLFAFSAYVYPKEVLKAVLEGSSIKVRLILYVSQGPSFSRISEVMSAEHVSAVCSLVGSIEKCVGLWRLQEVLGNYNWPEHLESDFIFGSSSIGSVNAQFLAAFSAAAGKRSVRLTESEESDPDWGCWSVSQELRNPSIRIIFPTIERVKEARSGILASKYLLCFSQKTWHGLKRASILHDAIPHPNERVGFPMHVKVAQRRFQSKIDASSFGWVYCGSHNFSAAAWGRPLSNTLDRSANMDMRSSSVLGSRLHVCNYELGIIFTVPPSDSEGHAGDKLGNLDDIILPFAVPAPKYRPRDRPATAQAMKEALAELIDLEKEDFEAAAITEEWPAGEVPDEEEEVLEAADFVAEEREDEKAYADKLWSQVDSSKSC